MILKVKKLLGYTWEFLFCSVGIGFVFFVGKFSFLYNIWAFWGFKGYFNNSLGVG